MLAIETKQLKKFYGKHVGINNVSLSVNTGEVFGFIGPNGAGKSTFIRTVLGLLKPTGGSASVLGENVFSSNKNFLKKIGYLPSEVNYYEDMSSLELLEYHEKFYGISNSSKINELAEYFELDLDKPIEDLSFGNKKKCAIIQCLLHNPELIILDEPTSGLDPLMQNRLFELLETENKKGKTIFFSSHILSEIQRMCDRAAIIKQGEIVAVENIQSLLAKQLKKIRVVFKEEKQVELPKDSKNIAWHKNKVTFDYVGNIGTFLAWSNSLPVEDITVQEPDLESIFMHYYQR